MYFQTENTISMEVMRCMDSKAVCLAAELTIQGSIGGMYLIGEQLLFCFMHLAQRSNYTFDPVILIFES